MKIDKSNIPFSVIVGQNIYPEDIRDVAERLECELSDSDITDIMYELDDFDYSTFVWECISDAITNVKK